jgi:FkbM family methyltransferase
VIRDSLEKLSVLTLDTIKVTLFHLGLDIQRAQNSLTEKTVLRQFFKSTPIDIICDVGANVGQYHDLVREVGYAAEIVSFEPLSQAHAELESRATSDPKWTIAPRQALGSEDTEIFINVASNSASSSILPMLERHRVAAPHSEYIAKELVPLRRLDSVAGSYLRGKSLGLLKIDTQGYEKEVLAGIQGVLSHFKATQVELSLVPLYGNQARLADLCNQLANLGFQLRYIIPGFRDPQTHELLQFDGIFISSH